MKTKYRIHKFAITGGPGGGKTTSLARLVQYLLDKGYYPLVAPEVATLLIQSGIRPDNTPDFQYHVLKDSLAWEKKLMAQAKKLMKKDPNIKPVLIFDRGLMDGMAYVPRKEFIKNLKRCKLTLVDARDRYDGVFHLVTAANGAEEYYTTENNTARSEKPPLARKRDRDVQKVWTGCPHFHRIPNKGSFEDKINDLISKIAHSLGLPEPLEIEFKYLIKKECTLTYLRKHVHVQVVTIRQDYLLPRRGQKGVSRVRARSQHGGSTYIYTEKIERGKDLVELERLMNKGEYLRRLLNADPTLEPVIKKRACFVWENTYYEFDIFTESINKAKDNLLEAETSDHTVKPPVPDFMLKFVVREVTNEKRYKNLAIAKRLAEKKTAA
jgi:CYTH domain-containing protein/predicted ATPase